MKTLILSLFVAACFAQPVPKQEPKKIDQAATMKPETKESLLVFQAQLNAINQLIDQSELGKRRAAITEKFQAALAAGRSECKGGEPTFGSEKEDGKVICAPPAQAKVEPKKE